MWVSIVNPTVASSGAAKAGMTGRASSTRAADAQARDLEFVQFHPTALDVPGLQWLPLTGRAA